MTAGRKRIFRTDPGRSLLDLVNRAMPPCDADEGALVRETGLRWRGMTTKEKARRCRT
jgi:hypothetical protein